MELERWCNDDNPDDRCDFIISNGQQCRNKIVPGATRCPLHGANKQIEKAKRESLNMYRLAKYQNRVDEFASHDKVKGLRDEIGILRMILEEKIVGADDVTELMLRSGPISDFVMKIEKLVSSCHRLEFQLGGLLDKTRIKQIANEMLNSVATRVGEILPDLPEEQQGLLLESIAGDILAAIERKA